MGISQVLSEFRCLPPIKFQNLIFYLNSYKDITHLFFPKDYSFVLSDFTLHSCHNKSKS